MTTADFIRRWYGVADGKTRHCSSVFKITSYGTLYTFVEPLERENVI